MFFFDYARVIASCYKIKKKNTLPPRIDLILNGEK
jgi:hypothetical protein